MIYLWNFIYLLLLLVVSPYYLLVKRVFQRGNYKLSDKFGKNLIFPHKVRKRLWFHAVSLGEVNLSIPLIKSLKERGDYDILLTTTTVTGLKVARDKLSELCFINPSPLDITFCVKNFFQKFQPDLVILVEGEIWPALLVEAKKRNVPVIIINGRFGKRTEFFFRLFKLVVFPILNKIEKFLVQSERTKNFLIDLGIDEKKILVVGSLKAELLLPQFSEDFCLRKKEELNLSGKVIVVAGSTSEGEEKILLRAFKKVKKENLVMLIAPRHPERFEKVGNLIKSFGFKYQKKSEFKREDFEILLIDTIGELPQFYAISDCSFVGGSLVKVGGHNFLEPIFYKKPVFFGPFMYNFKEIADLFISQGGARIVKNEKDIIEMFESAGSESQRIMGIKGHEILNKIKGAKEKTIKEIFVFLSP